MSATVEASKTAFEIYTPVVVGLGAVVLGLFANALLEWWKSHLANKNEVANSVPCAASLVGSLFDDW